MGWEYLLDPIAGTSRFLYDYYNLKKNFFAGQEIITIPFDESSSAVKKQISRLIQRAHRTGRKVGSGGQAPSDFSEFTAILVQEGIDPISLNPDSVVPTKKRIAEEEARRSPESQ